MRFIRESLRTGRLARKAEQDRLQWLRFRDVQHAELPRPVGPPPLISDDMLLLEAARSGLGVAALPSFLAQPDVAVGRLLRVLPELVVPMGSICLLSPPAKRLPKTVRVFADHLIEHLRSQAGMRRA